MLQTTLSTNLTWPSLRRAIGTCRTFGLSESAFLSAFLSACNDWRLALVVLPHHPDATEVAAAQSSCGTCRQWRRVLSNLALISKTLQDTVHCTPRSCRSCMCKTFQYLLACVDHHASSFDPFICLAMCICVPQLLVWSDQFIRC